MSALLAVALIVGIVLAVGDHPTGEVRTVASTTPNRVLPRRLTVRAALRGPWAPEPIAFDGHDVWLAPEDFGGHRPIRIELQRRSAVTGRLLDTVAIPQESVYAIATGEGTLWAVGGGDGGVPDTTVSRVDLASGHVIFTQTLTTPCSCAIAVGADAAWLAGQRTTHLLRLDPTTGKVAATITLPAASESVAVVHGKVQVGLDDSRVAVVDPATNTIERILTIAAPRLAAAGAIIGITPVGTTWDSWVTRSDGRAFELLDNATVASRPVTFLTPLVFSAASIDGDWLWGVGVDQVLFATTDGRTRGYANYDENTHSFGPLVARSRPFLPDLSLSTLRGAVAAGPTVWIEATDRIFVVAPS